MSIVCLACTPFLASCGGCEGIGTLGDVLGEPAIDITLADADGVALVDADVTCQLDGFGSSTPLLLISAGHYHCGNRPGLYSLHVTWRGAMALRSVTVGEVSACHHPMTVSSAFVLSPGMLDGGVPVDATMDAQLVGDLDGGAAHDAARDR